MVLDGQVAEHRDPPEFLSSGAHELPPLTLTF
jgi:hypothetical protein